MESNETRIRVKDLHIFSKSHDDVLLNIIERKIKDENVIWLIKTILKNHKTVMPGKGMPIGNLTSQFFANVYLNELDQFVKHELKAKYYIRYVDDFLILHPDKRKLKNWQLQICSFLTNELKVELHPEKTRITNSIRGVTFLGFRIFNYHKLIKKSNSRRIWKRLKKFKEKHDQGKLTNEEIRLSLEGWLAYARFANTHRLRNRVIGEHNKMFSLGPDL